MAAPTTPQPEPTRTSQRPCECTCHRARCTLCGCLQQPCDPDTCGVTCGWWADQPQPPHI